MKYEEAINYLTANEIRKYNSKYFNIEDLSVDYFEILMTKNSENSNSSGFEDLRYCSIHFSRLIPRLLIPFCNMCYYKEKIIDVNNQYYSSRIKENEFNREMFFYYFYSLGSNIYSLIDKIYISIDLGFELELTEEERKRYKESKICEKIKDMSNGFNTEQETINFLEFAEAYPGSIFERFKKEYRNKDVHYFTEEIPKYILKNGQYIIPNSPLSEEKAFDDILELLQKFKNFLELYDKMVKKYIDDYLV